jgi:thymidylate synthase
VKVLNVRNVHEALPKALRLLRAEGVISESRNGQVLRLTEPVATVYERPKERVLFHPERDANPFFHLYEALWMLAGMRSLEPLAKYAKQMAEYSDDGYTLHGAYGYRWRHLFQRDQLLSIVNRLRRDPTDRRCVLQMWCPQVDMDRDGKDVPCNLTATFQVVRRKTGGFTDDYLDLAVFCRSNDIIWGAYGANAVHFSVLQEYMAYQLGLPMGTYTQVSVNWHAYTNVLEKVGDIPENRFNPYMMGDVLWPKVRSVSMYLSQFDNIELPTLINRDKDGFPAFLEVTPETEWWRMVYAVLHAHARWRERKEPERYETAMEILSRRCPQDADWIVAAKQWIQRRHDAWKEKEH